MNCYFEAQSHGFGTGCLRFVPPSRTTTQNSLPGVTSVPGWDSSVPTEFLWRVLGLPRPAPLPGLVMARQNFNLNAHSIEYVHNILFYSYLQLIIR